MAETKLLIGSVTDVGQRRDHNEDDLVTFPTEDGGYVLVVADGMGGHLAGEVASAKAIEVFRRELQRATDDPSAALRAAIELANREIWDEAAWTAYSEEQEESFAQLSEEVFPGV